MTKHYNLAIELRTTKFAEGMSYADTQQLINTLR
jgi:hypothetical protein